MKPSLAFYFDVPLREAVRRIADGRPAFKFYEAGMDLNLSLDPAESFHIYQGLIQTQYEKLIDELFSLEATIGRIGQKRLHSFNGRRLPRQIKRNPADVLSSEADWES